MPRVSVIIPCYNLGAYLDEALESVRAQRFADFEVILVDDGSDDPFTQARLAELENTAVQVLRSENRGVAAARNRGIEAARGEYILPLDADDRIAPAYLKQAVRALDADPAVGIVYCHAELFGELSGVWDIPAFSLPHHLLDNLIFSAAIFRRADWLRVGGYNEAMLHGWEDWDFWNRLLGLGRRVVRLPEVLFSYRIRTGSRERSLGKARKTLLMLGLLLDHHQLYLRHAGTLCCILLKRSRRRPAEIKVQ